MPFRIPATFNKSFFQRNLYKCAFEPPISDSPFAMSQAGSPDWHSTVELEQSLKQIYGGGGSYHDFALPSFPLMIKLMGKAGSPEKIKSLIPYFLSSECLLLSEDRERPYRDHLFHPIWVALFGNWFLSNRGILEAAAECLKGKWEAYATDQGLILAAKGEWEKLLQEAWWTAALYHDHCYPPQFCLGRARQSKDAYASDWTGANPVEVVQTCIDRFNATNFYEHIKSDWILIKDLIERDEYAAIHAPLGGLNLLVDKEFYYREPFHNGHAFGPNPRWNIRLEMAAAAIFLHHQDERDFHFEEEPLAFLLKLCDGFQEWYRFSLAKLSNSQAMANMPVSKTGKRMIHHLWRRGIVSEMIITPVQYMRIEGIGGEYNLRYKLSPQEHLDLWRFDRDRFRNDLRELSDHLKGGSHFKRIRIPDRSALFL